MPGLLAKTIWIKPACYCTSACTCVAKTLHADQDDRGQTVWERLHGKCVSETKSCISDQAFHFQFQKQCRGGYTSQYTYFSSLVARTISLPKPNGGDSEVPLRLLSMA